MYVKLMGSENVPDSDTRKTYRLLANVEAVLFERKENKTVAKVTFLDLEVETFNVEGNVYIMNDNGKTVSTFGLGSVIPFRYEKEFQES